ncbi:transforming growth factor beta regulator 1 [Nowakowskiella sp. JEL0407]|nr:transforming growth factor beta regulator 1 [Nowakowskiella sp. JEL0407]
MIVRKVHKVERDEFGRPVLPIQFGQIKLVSLGTVEYENEKYHNQRYIFPVGYTIIRDFASMSDGDKLSQYIATVLKGDDGPIFEITTETGSKINASTASTAWAQVIKVANSIRSIPLGNASGPELYGFTTPTIAMLIQELPNAEKCVEFVKQMFEVGAGRGSKKHKLIEEESKI